MINDIDERLKYFSIVLVPMYEKQFNISLENAIFWNPVGILNHPEEVEQAITLLEGCLESRVPLNEDEIQQYNPEVSY